MLNQRNGVQITQCNHNTKETTHVNMGVVLKMGRFSDYTTLEFADQKHNVTVRETPNEEERREQEADRRHWRTRLARLDQELQAEPERILRSYDVAAHRLEPVGLVYLWPVSG